MALLKLMSIDVLQSPNTTVNSIRVNLFLMYNIADFEKEELCHFHCSNKIYS